MSTQPAPDVEIAVVGAGVVGCAVALALARRGVTVVQLEAEPQPALAASATNSGILHAAFDSPPGELETRLILRSAQLRPHLLKALDLPVLHCGASVQARDQEARTAISRLAANAVANGVLAQIEENGSLSIPGEAVTDPVAFTLTLAAGAQQHGARLLTSWRVAAIERTTTRLVLIGAGGERLTTRVAVNCAGLYADAVARLAGDDSFEIYPRKGEFLVFEPADGERLERILLPVPSTRTKGVLVFPTLDGMIIAGPTAVDIEDKRDWSVRPQARAEIIAKASAMHPPLADLEPVFAYAGLRPAGRGVNYLIAPSRHCERLVNVAAIRSTGLTASLGIAEHVAVLVSSVGVQLGPERALGPASVDISAGPWWRRAADHRATGAR
jgi:glycerol-3-phosphate dehydrogenase